MEFRSFGVLLFLAISGVNCLACLKCDSAIKPRFCTDVEHCGQHEVCSVDAYVTSSGEIRFNVGCRDRMFCPASAYPVGKRGVSSTDSDMRSHEKQREAAKLLQERSGTRVCSECCDTNLCNSGGCGTQGYDQSLGPICYACAAQIGTSGCRKIEQCGRDKVCGITPISLPGEANAYMTSCKHPWDCNSVRLPDSSGNGLYKCSTCCNQSLCNSFISGSDLCNSQTYWIPTSSRPNVTPTPTMKVPIIPTVFLTPTPKPYLHYQSGCLYKNQVYQQGQVWHDGCQYKCTCHGGSTGEYNCIPLCVTWNLPAMCHLDPPIPGKCCSTPNCPPGYQIKYPDGYSEQ